MCMIGLQAGIQVWMIGFGAGAQEGHLSGKIVVDLSWIG